MKKTLLLITSLVFLTTIAFSQSKVNIKSRVLYGDKMYKSWKWWSEDGKMDSSGTYKIGIKDGKWIHSTEIGNGKYEVRYTTGNIDLATFTDNLGQTYSGIPVNEEPKADGQYLGQEHEYNFSIYPEIYIYPF